jgi:hypothetical protein
MKHTRRLPRLRRAHHVRHFGESVQDVQGKVRGYDLLRKAQADVTLDEMHRRQV